MTVTAFDDITLEQLQATNSVKWSMFPGTIGAFVAEMDFGIAPAVRAAMDEATRLNFTGYLPPAVAADMSAAGARWLKDRFDWQIDSDWVRPAPDVIAALVQTIENFSPAGSKIIVPTPAYMPFLTVPGSLGRDIIEVPLTEKGGRMVLDPADLTAAFEAGGGLLIWCNPHNPLGTVATREEMMEIANIVDAHGGRVFSDEIHAPIVYGDAVHVPYASVSPSAAGHTVTAMSASKAWNLAGMKCAQVVFSNQADRDRWSEIGFLTEHGASNHGVVANIAAYDAGREWLDEIVDYLDGNRQKLAALLAAHLPQARFTMPEGTYIGWVDLTAYGVEGDLAAHLREVGGVAVSDGASCGAVGVGHVRIIFATPRQVLEPIVLGLKKALAA